MSMSRILPCTPATSGRCAFEPLGFEGRKPVGQDILPMDHHHEIHRNLSRDAGEEAPDRSAYPVSSHSYYAHSSRPLGRVVARSGYGPAASFWPLQRATFAPFHSYGMAGGIQFGPGASG